MSSNYQNLSSAFAMYKHVISKCWTDTFLCQQKRYVKPYLESWKSNLQNETDLTIGLHWVMMFCFLFQYLKFDCNFWISVRVIIESPHFNMVLNSHSGSFSMGTSSLWNLASFLATASQKILLCNCSSFIDFDWKFSNNHLRILYVK